MPDRYNGVLPYLLSFFKQVFTAAKNLLIFIIFCETSNKTFTLILHLDLAHQLPPKNCTQQEVVEGSSNQNNGKHYGTPS